MTQSCRINKTYKPMIEDKGFETTEETITGLGTFYGGISTKQTKVGEDV